MLLSFVDREDLLSLIFLFNAQQQTVVHQLVVATKFSVPLDNLFEHGHIVYHKLNQVFIVLDLQIVKVFEAG
jgi:hypothetical protein